ncbi:hypothetical protein K2173_006157 [Erythroxylum novogranatense]|uniref:B-like cyclin n=1 Tax=Erythroxylum novogranatense TaxID=1862640 RepID=A0AAV8TCG8_9ROSI|nr:hypothetical protein K2173_006157 [Erythroxylum novogranatense]
MALQEGDTTQQLQSPALVLDGLYCEEGGFEDDSACFDGQIEIFEASVKKDSFLPLILLEQDLFWDDSELLSLLSKEKETHFDFGDVVCDEALMAARRDAVEWIFRVKAHYGFSALTSVLAVNYFDRFISSFKLQRDKPWMGQLTAVACLSLAAKVEEIHVPLLLDLQVEESKYVFEAKTIKRMELLVLSTLRWRMNLVTPISFFDYIVRRIGLKNHLPMEFLCRCERLVLSVVADSRFTHYLPSTLATATMLHVIEKVVPFNQLDYQNQLLSVLRISEYKVKECYEDILEVSGSKNRTCKRKHPSTPSSQNGIIDTFFSSDNSNDSWAMASSVGSNDSWAMASSVSSSPTSCFKRSRAQDQQMRLPSLNRMFVDVLSSPH